MTRERLVPLIVAVALFMENMDSTVISTSPVVSVPVNVRVPLSVRISSDT